MLVLLVTIYLYETRQESVEGGSTERTYSKTIPSLHEKQRTTETDTHQHQHI